MEALEEVLVAALLHDIGKFGQRAGERGKHPEISRRFVDSVQLPEGINRALVAELVSRHHDGEGYPDHLRVSALAKGSVERNLARIVSEADNLSSGMDREEDEEGVKDRALISVLSEVDIHDEPGKKPTPSYLLPGVFEPKNLVPVAETIPKEELDTAYKGLWSSFNKECQNLPTADFDAWYITMDALLKKYTSTALSAGYRTVPNIPLYDHLKTTAAIAACLSKAREVDPSVSVSVKQKKSFFLFIEGDLSGIQNFIFQTHNAQKASKRAAKRLRGRSFYLYLLSEAICRKILKELGLLPTSLLWNAGGNFLILAPNTTDVRRKLESLEKKIARWIYKDHGNDLYLALYWAEASPEDVKEFGEYKEETLGRLSRRAKMQRFSSIAHESKLFEPEGENVPEGMHCPICGQKSTGEESCATCKSYEEIGTHLVKANRLLIGKNLEEPFKKILEIEFGFPTRDDQKEHLRGVGEGFGGVVVCFNSLDFLPPPEAGSTRLGYTFKYVGKGVPLRGKRPITFGEIAQFSIGPAKLGIMKADVDNLGKIFAKGLEEKADGPVSRDPGKRKKASISRVHFLSTMLDTFFTGYLNEMMSSLKVYYDLCERCSGMPGVKPLTVTPDADEEKEPENPYTVYRVEGDATVCKECSNKDISTPYITYSGGDDLLIVGPYDHIIEGAELIRKKFREFTGNNLNLTLSAGIAITGRKLPMQKGTEAAEEMLDESKGRVYHFAEKPTKDSITVFGETVVWDSKEYKGNDSKGFNDLLNLGRRLEQDVNSGAVTKRFVYSLLELWYSTFRDVKPEDMEKNRLTRKRYVPKLKYNLARNVKDQEAFSYYDDVLMDMMPWARVPASWASLRTRKRGD